MKIHIDGQLFDEADAKISVFDHGLLYGDGVFEGIRMYHGRVFKLEEHMDRLYDSARVLCLEIPVSKEQMTADLLATIRANDLRDGYVRLVVTRGVGDLGINPRLCPKASVIIIAATIKLYSRELYEKGLDIITCATRRMSQAALPPAVKSLNYLNNIMAKIEAHQANAAEALMLNEAGLHRRMHGRQRVHHQEGHALHPAGERGQPAWHHARSGPRHRRRTRRAGC